MKNKAVVILSGGMDSTTLLYSLVSQKYDIVSAISFNYGQRHLKEVECAKSTISFLREIGHNIKHIVLEVPFGQFISSKSSLTSASVSVPEGHYAKEIMKQTVILNRNLIFISIAAVAALSENAILALGVHANDSTIYPDCREPFLRSAAQTIQMGNWDAEQFEIYTPFLFYTKSQIVSEGVKIARNMGISVNQIYSRTWSCYKGEEVSCGKCGTCVERVLAFDDAGVEDPVPYQESFLTVLAHAKVLEWEYQRNMS